VTSYSSILLKSKLDKGVKRGIRLGSVSISSKQLISHRLSKVGATYLWRIGVYVFLIIIFKVVNRVFLIVVSKIVNRVLYVVYLLVFVGMYVSEYMDRGYAVACL
jgi:hypothetical protein